jgi:hypothetical protein
MGRQEDNPMTQPIGSGFYCPPSAHLSYDDAIDNAAQRFCRNASTVTEGFLCDETTVVSKACRSPTNAVDAFVCDDKKMADLQHSLWDTVKDTVRMIAGILMGRMP